MDPSACVVLVPYCDRIAPACEDGLRSLERAGYAVRRAAGAEPIDLAKSALASDALADGFAELFWIDPDVGFDIGDVARLRRHGRPFVCGLLPEAGAGGFACEFAAGTESVVFGHGGGLYELPAADLGFALVRREVYDHITAAEPPAACDGGSGRPFAPWFLPTAAGAYRPADFAFCDRARRAGVPLLADTTVRLTRYAVYGYTWEDTGGPPERRQTVVLGLTVTRTEAEASPAAPVHPLRPPAAPLPAGFPRIRMYVVTYPANRDSLERTLADIRASDWGAEPSVMTQPADWPVGGDSFRRNFLRTVERALTDGVDFALILEDDVRVCRHLRHNLHTLPLIARDQCDYLSLYVPDVVADPWERTEPHLGYRLARPLYSAPPADWMKRRLWGSQAYCLSRRLLQTVADRWEVLGGLADGRVLDACLHHGLPLYYTAPCWADHAVTRSAFDSPTAYAPDFEVDFRLAVRAGFQPPEQVPGWLTRAEGELLWQRAAGLPVLELGTAAGRATVCLAQSADRVLSVDRNDQSEAAEWVRRFGYADRVEFQRGDVTSVPAGHRYGLVFVDTGHDAASVERDIGIALRHLAPGGVLAFHDYPDPSWPDVRRVVDAHAHRLGWRRTGQADYLGIFQT